MHVRLIATPFEDTEPALGPVLRDALRDLRFDAFLLVVAWVKRSGLRLVADDMRAFNRRGGRIRAIVGVDERGATRQGLELVRDLAHEVVVYRDPSGGTFHPKIYALRGNNDALVIVGSSNLTRGGLFDNYESSIAVELDLPADHALLDEVDHLVNLLVAQTEVALPLTDDLMARLLASPLVQDEDEQRSAASADSESRAPVLPFGRPASRKIRVPPLASVAQSPTARGRRTTRARQQGRTVAESAPARISRRWYKKLSASDAQHTPTGTNITGELRLTQAGFNIDQTTYFRRNLLRGARWRATRVSGRPAQEADVEFDVRFGSRYLGRRRLRVTYVPHREFGQRNYTTAIKWGTLADEIRAEDRTGQWVVLDIDDDGRSGLSIQETRPSPVGDED